MIATKFASFCLNGISDGCKYCVRGKKSVLFVGGSCSRSCWYCSLSNFRKKTGGIFINERPVRKIEDIFEEIKESNSDGIGVTGGDPLLNFKRTLFILKRIRKVFERKFHIHIYLPLNLVDERKLKELSFIVDEIRFHPSIFLSKNKELIKKEIRKIELASKIFDKDIGIEIPCIPNQEKLILNFILMVKDFVSFVNLNEFEISETNQKIVEKKFVLNNDTYTIKNSLKTGKKILNILEKKKIGLRVHLCSAKTKDLFQYRNRLRRREVPPFCNKLKNGNVTFFCVYWRAKDNLNKIKRIIKNCFYDRRNKRIIIKRGDVLKLVKKGIKVFYVEEIPSFKGEIVFLEKLN